MPLKSWLLHISESSSTKVLRKLKQAELRHLTSALHNPSYLSHNQVATYFLSMWKNINGEKSKGKERKKT
jgi:flagellar motor switch protein FliG